MKIKEIKKELRKLINSPNNTMGSDLTLICGTGSNILSMTTNTDTWSQCILGNTDYYFHAPLVCSQFTSFGYQ